ncbi:MAG: Mrp/NBP35 family ATP-binding protein [Chloroflexi bacterium]|nr:Mrp/NBP35 family ATP-binding protein [Chloroflexota bacterium]
MSKALHEKAMKALSTVIEPELGRDIVTLDMVRDLTIENGVANFTIVLTTPACPLKGVFIRECERVLLPIDGIDHVNIKWDANVPRGLHGNLDMPLQNIIAVGSGKGGVGKSTVATNLAVSLAEQGARVGLMDADILGPNIPTMVGLGFAKPHVIGGEGENDQPKMVPFEAYGVKVMSMGFLADPNTPMIWRGPMLHGAIRQFFTDVAWGELDYMVVDLPPGTGDAALSLAQSVPLTGAVIVTQPQEVALEDARRAIGMFNKLNVPVLGVVENMAGEVYGQGGGEKLAETRNLPFLGRVPLQGVVREGGDAGKPVVISDPDSDAGKAFYALAQNVAARISVVAMANANVIPLNIIG